ncbi:diphosphomevalonate decarboxylase [Bifidobacterium crudilactis]|jgi:diphosphomevalonate decarboxylase|uniref:diphosphomevalonate decarboxylase n=1 Tax=Bifidobacterium crudilactis TaxID=327277 RepID=UPI0009FC5ABD|nr:diphosphomevalonate decarboxylase [Bifidobacterium crudilactis]MCI2149300.1 diphosphomevalonate decarboxylase [Bifidobacterium crudilactis]MCI2157480.1 diphosphomevalonate decarboxylase [Bifidobacterium crudilactis]
MTSSGDTFLPRVELTDDTPLLTNKAAAGGATATANANIALVKYWGKADEDLIIPRTSSLSLTLEGLETTSSVCFREDSTQDRLFIDDVERHGKALNRVSALLDLVREQAGVQAGAVVTSRNTVPYEAGLASSSSAFAALALAASHAAGLRLNDTELSRLARRGSGSASRSVFGGLAVWHAGHDDASSYAEAVDCPLDLAIVVVLISGKPKKISSREAMRRSVETSDLYDAWVRANPRDLERALKAVKAGDITALGEVAQGNFLGMHATMMTAKPPVMYWMPGSVEALQAVDELRQDGLPAWATMDAGPNVKVLTTAADARRVEDELRLRLPRCAIHTHLAGPGVRLL